MHFPIPSFEQRKNLRKKLENVGNGHFEKKVSSEIAKFSLETSVTFKKIQYENFHAEVTPFSKR